MKRNLILLLCLVLALVVLVGCNQHPGTETTAPTEPLGFDPTRLTLNGVPIEEYVIVYGPNGLQSQIRASGNWIESGRLEDVANLLSDALFELTGKRLPVVSEDTKEKDHEIIVGLANRVASKTFYMTTIWKKDKYAYGIYENKVILAGGSSNACYFAAMDFVEACSNPTTYDFSADMVKATAELIEVACIGDSITDGVGYTATGETDRNYYSWPVYLQRMLGYKYYVGNYGYGSKLMTDFAMYDNFDMSVDAKPDVVLMMLGTNDAAPHHTGEKWGTAAYKQQYFDAAEDMISQYRKANQDVQIFIMSPIVIYRQEHAQRAQLAIQYDKELAQKYDLVFVDMWTPTEKGNWEFYDGLHPQGEVYGHIGQCVYDGIKEMIIK